MTVTRFADGLAVVPVLITQRNCEAAAGLTPRQFLDLLRAHPGTGIRIGKVRAVAVDDLLRLVRTPAALPAALDDEVDSILASIGKQRKRSW